MLVSAAIRDSTERKRAEAERARLLTQLSAANERLQDLSQLVRYAIRQELISAEP